MGNEPLKEVTNWQFYFDISDGLVNRSQVLRSFIDFLKEPEEEFFAVPGAMMLGGNCSYDGVWRTDDEAAEVIFSPHVKSIRRVERLEDDFFFEDDYLAEMFDTGFMFVADMEDGDSLKFRGSAGSYNMAAMLSDLLHERKLKPGKGKYLRDDQQGLPALL